MSESTNGFSDDFLRHWDDTIGDFFEQLNIDDLFDALDKDFEDYQRKHAAPPTQCGKPLISPYEYQHLNKGHKYRIHDPLALDLDGNGIRTVAANQFSGSLRAEMAILTGLLAYCFNGNNIFAVLKRQAYNYSTNSHTIQADGGWFGMLKQGRAGVDCPSPPRSKAT